MHTTSKNCTKLTKKPQLKLYRHVGLCKPSCQPDIQTVRQLDRWTSRQIDRLEAYAHVRPDPRTLPGRQMLANFPESLAVAVTVVLLFGFRIFEANLQFLLFF